MRRLVSRSRERDLLAEEEPELDEPESDSESDESELEDLESDESESDEESESEWEESLKKERLSEAIKLCTALEERTVFFAYAMVLHLCLWLVLSPVPPESCWRSLFQRGKTTDGSGDGMPRLA